MQSWIEFFGNAKGLFTVASATNGGASNRALLGEQCRESLLGLGAARLTTS
jgi:hypothetical protein